MLFDDPMTSTPLHAGHYGYEGWLDSSTETRVHCLPVPHDRAILKLSMRAYEDHEASTRGTLIVTPPAGTGITSISGDNESDSVGGNDLWYGRISPWHPLNFDETQGGIWLHSLTGWSDDFYYWEFNWTYW